MSTLSDSRTGIVESLCDFTGNMVRPWAVAGYECRCYDLRIHLPDIELFPGGGSIRHFFHDVRLDAWPERTRAFAIAFAFPPCTDLAVSGAKHFRSKGLRRLIEALEIVELCRERLESLDCPWMLENPVSVLSSYWREPDYTFNPYEYFDRDGGSGDTYTKKTCVWTGGGFVMPDRTAIVDAPLFNIQVAVDDRIHKAPPGPERSNFRSATPQGFAQAVFEANQGRTVAA